MVARLLWEQEVGGSRPPSPTGQDQVSMAGASCGALEAVRRGFTRYSRSIAGVTQR